VKEKKYKRVCYASNARQPIYDLMLVVMFNGVDVTLHDGGRGALEREARGTGGDTEVGNLTIGDIVYESCVWAVK
jgi:hypothetical protein